MQLIHTIHMPTIAAPSRRVLLLASAGVLVVGAFAFLYLDQPYVQAVNHSLRATGGSAATAASIAASTSAAAMHEVNIANNGLVYLENVRVDSTSDSLITVGISWGRTTFPWVIDTTSGKGGTKFIQSNGDVGSIADVQAGDIVSITGMLDTTMMQPTINAQYVREE
jgi:hypothetical protein